jgi:hypothetical protein
VTRSAAVDTDQAALDVLVREFLDAFSNARGQVPNVRRLYELVLSSAVIVKATGGAPEVYSLRDFVEPRQVLLTGGTLLDFEEAEVSARTHVAGDVAQRYSVYRKAGVQAGRSFETRGVKLWQFVRMPAGWRVSALAWDDERDGLTVPEQAP